MRRREREVSEIGGVRQAVVPRRARIQGSWTLVSLNSRLESNKAEEDLGEGHVAKIFSFIQCQRIYYKKCFNITSKKIRDVGRRDTYPESYITKYTSIRRCHISPSILVYEDVIYHQAY